MRKIFQKTSDPGKDIVQLSSSLFNGVPGGPDSTKKIIYTFLHFITFFRHPRLGDFLPRLSILLF